jgi:hypothetical protein
MINVDLVLLLYVAVFLSRTGTSLGTAEITVLAGELSSADTYARNVQRIYHRHSYI